MSQKPRRAAVEGWFTFDDPSPALLGTQCRACRTYFFPPERVSCRNPSCGASDLVEIPLSRRGKIWSFTINHYAPPPPAVVSEPYGVAAVELGEERMVVLGQIDGDASGIRVGDEVELTVGLLYEDEENEYVVWKWRSVR